MRWIWRTLLVLIIPAILFTLIPLLFHFGILWVETPVYFPTEGIWYCQELQIQASFGETGETFIVVDGEKISCDWEYDKGSKWLTFSNQDQNTEIFELGETVFSGTYVHLDTSQLILREADTGQEYTFVKISSDHPYA